MLNDFGHTSPAQFYECFFNYELTTHTWRHFVNKQILQTYHRLLIEKQLEEMGKKGREVKEEIDKIDYEIKQIR